MMINYGMDKMKFGQGCIVRTERASGDYFALTDQSAVVWQKQKLSLLSNKRPTEEGAGRNCCIPLLFQLMASC